MKSSYDPKRLLTQKVSAAVEGARALNAVWEMAHFMQLGVTLEVSSRNPRLKQSKRSIGAMIRLLDPQTTRKLDGVTLGRSAGSTSP